MAGPEGGNPYAAPRWPDGAERPGDDDVASELSYFPEDERHTSSGTAIWWLFLPMLSGAALAGLSGSGAIGLLGVALALGGIYCKRRQSRVVPRAKLRVEADVLHLSGRAFSPPIVISLSQLLDVSLDTRTIWRAQRVRIALELENETLFLNEKRVSHTDANESFSKIRRFLRRHGWVPNDERAA